MKRLVPVLCLGLIILGCGGGGGTTPPPTGPITLNPAFDNTRAATADIIAADGGVLTATDVDGRTITLTIPPDALDRTTTITLTPLNALPGIPGGGSLFMGYAIEPAGITFAAPATITVTMPPTDVAGLLPFQMTPAGASAARAGAAPQPSDFYPGFAAWTCNDQGKVDSFTLNATRGLIQGIALGGRAVLEAILQRLPSDACAVLEAQVWGHVQTQLNNPCADFKNLYVAEMIEQAVSVGNVIDAAKQNAQLFEPAVTIYLCWRGMMEYIPAPLPDPLLTLIQSGRDNLGLAADSVIARAEAAKETHDLRVATDLVLLHQLLRINVLEPVTLLSDRNPEDVAALYAELMTFKFEALWEGRYTNNGSGFGLELMEWEIKWNGPRAAMRLPLDSSPQLLNGPFLELQKFTYTYRDNEDQEYSWNQIPDLGRNCSNIPEDFPVPVFFQVGLSRIWPEDFLPGQESAPLSAPIEVDWTLCLKRVYLPPSTREPFNTELNIILKVIQFSRREQGANFRRLLLNQWSAPQAAEAITTCIRETSGTRVEGNFSETGTERFTAVVKHAPQ